MFWHVTVIFTPFSQTDTVYFIIFCFDCQVWYYLGLIFSVLHNHFVNILTLFALFLYIMEKIAFFMYFQGFFHFFSAQIRSIFPKIKLNSERIIFIAYRPIYNNVGFVNFSIYALAIFCKLNVLNLQNVIITQFRNSLSKC